MRNVFLFVKQNFNLIFFFLLQGFALYMLSRYNKFHEAAFLNAAGSVTGKINQQYNRIEYYFQLKKTNAILIAENEQLRNLLKEDFLIPDTSALLIDSIRQVVDSNEAHRRFLYYPAKVINNSVTAQTNYVTIARGSAQGIQKDMAVVSPEGVVGTVVNVSKNMATIMSLLHRQSRISASLLKSGETGSVEWDGVDPQVLTYRNIPRTVDVNVGDTVVTSRYSTFPPNQVIGVVVANETPVNSNFYTLKIKPSTNFYNVQFVYVVKNLLKEEQDLLEKNTHKQDQ